MPPSSLTLQYDALLSSTLFNYRRTLEDNISKTNALFHQLMRIDPAGYQTVSEIGDRMMMPLMYELGTADSYSGYDQLDVSPMDGITASFWEWRQASVPIAISALEEKKNRGEARILNLLEAKTQQAEMGIQEFFNTRLLIGAGGSTITTPYVSAMNGSSFIDPLPLLVKFDPTSSTVVGNINQNTHAWWRNQYHASTGATFAAFLTELRKLRLKANRGPGGKPNLHLVDEDTYSLYEQALAAKHQNPSYQKADIPFENIAFYGSAVVSDEKVPNVEAGTEAQSTTAGSWFMLNTKFVSIKVDSATNFAPTPFQKPENQDAKVAHILWLGAIGISNRRKQAVMGGIDTTLST